MLASSRATSTETTSSPARRRHAPHAGGVAAHGPHVVLGEADGHALRRDHEDVVVAAGLDDPDQLVAVAQVDGDEALPAGLVVLA